MDKAIKAKWLEALRSRKYRKCTGASIQFDDDGNPVAFCALGVLGHLTGAPLVILASSTGKWLSEDEQVDIARINDDSRGWKKTIKHIEEKL